MIGKTISHYKIIEKLGGGGMGVVYKAEDTKLKRTVALKFLPPAFSLDEEAKQRFINEAQAASSFDHRNICTIYEINETDDGQLFIAMAYYDGETLKKKIEKGPFKIEKAIDIVSQVAEGLKRAHQKGIIHRDIKPANIFITNDGLVKILDFGLAKVTSQSQMTKVGTIMGTAAYMSPEQTRGDDINQRTDIWSLGVILYEMLCRQLPFKGDYEQAIIYSILNEEPTLLNSLPKALENILNNALQKNPNDRYNNLNEILDDLKKLNRTDAHQAIVDKKDSESGEDFVERKMIVVLPFENLSSSEDEYFADGITEEITSRLSEINQLGVIGRTSATQYKKTDKTIEQIGEELGVDYLLEGSVRWEKLPGKESKIRVTPQLIKVSDGTHIWTKRYDAILKGVFDLQSDIAEKVANALDITLLGAEQKLISQKPTDNLEAYDYYLRGNVYYKQGEAKENHSVAEQMLLKATELDSNFVLAYTRLAQINVDFYWFYWDRTDNRLIKSKYYIDKAMGINPDLPEIYLALGQYYYHGFLDYDRALSEFDKGLKIKPNFEEILKFIGAVKRRQGKFEESIIDFKKSLELDPLNESINFEIGDTFLLIKNYEMAEKYLDKAISIVPDLGWPYVFKAKVYIYRFGNVNKAYQILKSSLDVVLREKWMVVSLLAQVQIFSGKYEEALKTLSDESSEVFKGQYRFVPKTQLLATIYGLQKNKRLEKACYDSAQVLIDSKLKELPDDANLHSALGLVLAGLGKKEEAIKEGKLAVKLLPIKKEAWRGWHRELDLAKIYTMVGEYDLAIDKLEYLLSIPGELSVPYIKLDPVWKPLFNNPRFSKVLEKYK